MTTLRSEFLKIMQERGFLHQCTDLEGLDKKLSEGVVTAYIGFDATAPSLHIGSLLPVMMLYWLQKTGHKPIVLMGGGTTKVGDPSGKDESRKLLTDDAINANIAGIQKIFAKYLSFGAGKTDAILVNNDAWLRDLKYIDFLREFGRHFTINRMLTFDSVKLRLEREQPLTFLEFNYMIMQAYDYYELSKRHNCILQLGASDQWGNILNGVELNRRVLQKESFGFTCPLLTKSDGSKMGKSASGAIWLNEDMLSPYDFYQYLRNTDDKDVGKLLRLLTVLPMDDVKRLEALKGSEINDAKKTLAFEVTKLCHGEAKAKEAAETARKTFEEGAAAEGLPTITLPRAKLADGIPAFMLFKDAGLAASGGEARRLIAGGGARINDEKVADEQLLVTPAYLSADKTIKLSAGKKKHVLVIVPD
ncbi:MAG: tyrosine--tRNA ligase [Alphaproteobacteria bacterium]|nr:tyrosine--tRNA ligase [Alphaproteobacteria bacterium]